MGRISAQITHEIRNPLNAIGLNAELLAEELAQARGAPAEAVQLVEAISREVDRLNGVTEEYLRFARLPRPALGRQDLNEILGSLLDFLAPELQAAGVEVVRELAPDAAPRAGRRGTAPGGLPEPAAQQPGGHARGRADHRPHAARTGRRSRRRSPTPGGGSPRRT